MGRATGPAPDQREQSSSPAIGAVGFLLPIAEPLLASGFLDRPTLTLVSSICKELLALRSSFAAVRLVRPIAFSPGCPQVEDEGAQVGVAPSSGENPPPGLVRLLLRQRALQHVECHHRPLSWVLPLLPSPSPSHTRALLELDLSWCTQTPGLAPSLPRLLARAHFPVLETLRLDGLALSGDGHVQQGKGHGVWLCPRVFPGLRLLSMAYVTGDAPLPAWRAAFNGHFR